MEKFREITEKYGFNYGPTFSIIKAIWERDNEGLCLVDISETLTIQAETGRYVVHPSILDACLQSCFVPLGSSLDDNKSIVPVGFKSIILNDMHMPSTNQFYCHVTADVSEFGRFHVTLMSPSGYVVLTMTDFRVAELTSSPRQLPFTELAYEVQWNEVELQKQRENAPHLTCIVLKDSSDFSNSLVTSLQALEVNVITIDPPNAGCFNSKVQESIKTVIADIQSGNSCNLRVINLWPVETTLLPDHFDVIEQAQRLVFSSSVFLLKLLIEKEFTDSHLFLVTVCTQLLNASDKSRKSKSIPWGSTVWGLRRTANLEEFNLGVTTVDLCNKEDKQEVDSLVDEILSDSIEDEVAFRDGKRFINRLRRAELQHEKSQPVKSKEHKKRGLLYLSTIPSSRKLCLREQSFPKPSHSEVTIDVHYCWTPSESLFDVTKPNGCVFVSGKVTNLPAKSEHGFKIGDEVCSIIPSGRVARSVPIQVSNSFIKPVSLTMEQATYIPACLALASRALQNAASAKENQKILIHQANRGPGLAAVVLGSTLGHRVFCTISDTCRTSTKTLLLDVGAEGVKRQSSTIFSDDSSDQLDAVVFFYPPFPHAIHRSCQSLKKGGRVVILSTEFDGDVIFPANKNVKYERESISDILRSPLAFEVLSLQSLQMLEFKGVKKQFVGVQVVSVDLAASIKAANDRESIDKRTSREDEVKQSSDISFLIHSLRTFEDENQLKDITVLPRGLDECGLKQNRTYLVAGGMRGYGFEVARWMVENGAKSIAVLGRSKPSDAKLQELRKINKTTGATIHTIQVSKYSLSALLFNMPPHVSRNHSIKLLGE